MIITDQMKSHELFSDIQPHILSHFWAYHESNPHVFDLFLTYAQQAKDAGYKRYGVGAIQERVRWHLTVETKNDPFKINNNYRSCYARLLTIVYPEFGDFFELRSPQDVERINREFNQP